MIQANWIVRAALACSLASMGVRMAHADDILASYLAAGVQIPATSAYETFDGLPTGNASGFTTNFNGSGYSGTYSGSITISSPGVYGGAGGVGKYAVVLGPGASYTLTLDHGANFFGLWFSALDSGNLLQFYNGGTLVYSFTPTDFISMVGGCPGSAFCDNPNSGGNEVQQYAYLNFYDPNGTFDSIVFSENVSGGFESDNQTVAMLSTAPAGTPITSGNAVPEPGTLLLFATGISALGALKLRYSN